MKKRSALFFLTALYFNINAQTLAYSWAKDLRGSGSEASNAITTDAAGNVYTVGRFEGSVDFDPGPGNALLTSNGNMDIFISKLDAAGNFVWARHIGSDLVDEAHDVAVDAQGNVFVTGYYKDTADFDPGPGVTKLISTGFLDAFVLKLDASGNFVWAKRLGTPLPIVFGPNSDFAEGKAIAVDASGNVYTAGRFSGIVDFDPGSGTFNQTAGGYDVYISKLDAQGDFVWLKKTSGANAEEVSDLALDNNTDPVICGHFYGTPDFDPGAGTFNMTNTASESAYVLKLDAAGVFQWAVKLAGDVTTIPKYLTLSAGGDVYLSGYYTGTTDFDPGAGTYTLTGGRTFVVKLNPGGIFAWAKGFAIANPGGLSIDNSGNVFLAGEFSGSVDFDPGPSNYILTTSNIANNLFIVKLDAAGNFMRAMKIGADGFPAPSALKLDAAGYAYVTGIFSGTTDFDPWYGTATLTPQGTINSDMYVLKLAPCTEPAAPVNSTNPANQMSCIGEPISLSASAGTTTVNWFGTAISTQVLTSNTTYTTVLPAAGTYSYYAETMSCAPSKARTVITVTVTDCTAIKNHGDTNDGMHLFPVPFSEELTITFERIRKNVVVVIYSQTGEIVFKNSLETTNEITIDLKGKTPGIYFAQIFEDGLPLTVQKIIKH